MPGFAGFDRSVYPGDDAMAWLRANTNLAWCGYYLAPAPSHQDASWMGKRAQLADTGWGLSPVFVGQQVVGPGSKNASVQTGATDGQSAADMMAAEGFPPGSFVYIDLENGPPVPKAQRDYVTNWCDAVTNAGFGAGIYCSHLIAFAVHTLRPDARIWAFAVATTKSHPVPQPYPDPNPSGCGYIGAYSWQLGQACIIQLPAAGLQTLIVDLSSAITTDPSAP